MFQLLSNNGKAFKRATVELSTVYLLVPIGRFEYESCVFTETDSEVLNRYLTLPEAIAGHKHLSDLMGLK